MTIKGFLRLCAGIVGANTLTFEDAEVTTPVTLKRLTQDQHSGIRSIALGEVLVIEENKEMRISGKQENAGIVENNGVLVID